MINTPVAFFIYNRPDLTKLSFESIAKVKPRKLFIIADGAKTREESLIVEETRSIVSNIEWECEVTKNFSDQHLGCGKRVLSGLEWLFSIVEEAIIIEDDIVANESFFRFCQELLYYYKDNEHIFTIGGCNIGFEGKNLKSSYFFSKFMNMWGWATWRRAFKNIDFSMTYWEKYRESKLFRSTLGHDPLWRRFWTNVGDQIRDNKIDTWDYQWIMSQLFQGGLSIVPAVNMVKNIGYGSIATHTVNQTNTIRARVQARDILFPLKHPDAKEIRADRKYDQFIKSGWCDLPVKFRYRIKYYCKYFIKKLLSFYHIKD